MDCDPYRLAISASADGEEPPIGAAELDAHLLGCDGCRGFAAELLELDGVVQQATSRPTPDLTASILAAVPAPSARATAPRRVTQVRAFLALAGVVQLVVTIDLLLGTGLHVTRDLAAFELALAGALLYAAWRPATAAGLLPVVAMVAAVGLLGATVDAASGSATLASELPHLLPVLTVAPLRRLSREHPTLSVPTPEVRW